MQTVDLPDDVNEWRLTVDVVMGVVCIARRGGVTLQFVNRNGWWSVTKIERAVIVGERRMKNLPPDLAAEIQRRRLEVRRAKKARTAAVT